LIQNYKPFKHILTWLPTASFLLFAAFLSTFFLFGFGAHTFSSQHSSFPFSLLLKMVSLGLVLALLASLLAWPLALSIAILFEQNKSSRFVQGLKAAARFLATLPLLFFVYLYVEVIGSGVFLFLEEFWTSYLTPSHIMTQTLAFALTLLLYPLRVLPGVGVSLTIDEFFRQMLLNVVEFSEVGLAVSLLTLGLVFYILPRMVVSLLTEIKNSNSHLSFEVIQSLGGSRWEGTQMTVLQLMRQKAIWTLAYFTRLCFFEGLITYTLLHFFLFKSGHMAVGQTLSARYLHESFSLTPPTLNGLLLLAGVLFMLFLILFGLESFLKKISRSDDV